MKKRVLLPAIVVGMLLSMERPSAGEQSHFPQFESCPIGKT